MKTIGPLVFACVAALAPAETRLRKPICARRCHNRSSLSKACSMCPALSPLCCCPREAAKYSIQIETVMFQRFAERTHGAGIG